MLIRTKMNNDVEEDAPVEKTRDQDKVKKKNFKRRYNF